VKYNDWNYPINTVDLPETVFFYAVHHVVGWNTWRWAWPFFDKNPQKLSKIFTKAEQDKLDYDAGQSH